MNFVLSFLLLSNIFWHFECTSTPRKKPIVYKYPRYSFNSALSKLSWFAANSTVLGSFRSSYYNPRLIEELDLFKKTAANEEPRGDYDCFIDMLDILKNMFKFSGMENYRWFDASGRPMPGIAGGAIHWPGSFDLCIGSYAQFDPNNIIPVKEITANISGKYCDFVIDVPSPANFSNGFDIAFSLGLCIPRTCNFSEFIYLIDPVFSKFSLQIDKAASYCHSSPEDLPKDGWFWIAVSVASFFLFVMSFGTLLDIITLAKWKINCLRNAEVKYYGVCDVQNLLDETTQASTVTDLVSTSLEAVEAIDPKSHLSTLDEYTTFRSKWFEGKSPLIQYFGTYGVLANGIKLLSAPRRTILDENGNVIEHPLHVLDGVRVITMAWIIYGHCTLFPIIVTNNIILFIQSHLKRWTFQALLSGTLAVDTFFFMSGLLTSYIAIPRLSTLNSFKDWIKFWVAFVFHRIIRLTPTYLTVIILYTGFFLHAWDGPLYPQRAELSDIKFCRSHWWVTYLNNFIYEKEVCLPWSWYLANELQFSIVLAPIFLTLLQWHTLAGLSFAFALMGSSFGSVYGISYVNHFLPGMLSPDSFTTIYVKPYARWGTYAIGLILGWILHCKTLKLPQRTSALRSTLISTFGVLLASLCCISVTYGLYGVVSGKQPLLSDETAAMYNAMHRMTFTFGLSIIVYLCANRYAAPIRSILGWTGFVPLSRLTYGVYLIHPIIIMYITLGAQSPTLMDDLFLITLFAATFCFSHLGSVILTLATESPTILIEKKLLSR